MTLSKSSAKPVNAKTKLSNPTQIAIAQAFAQYKQGSKGVVRAFEQAIKGYWTTDSCNPTNLEFFLNQAGHFPRLQKVAKSLIDNKFGKFTFKATKNKETGMISYSVVNSEDKATKAEKKAFREAVDEFIKQNHTSLLHEPSVKVSVEWDEEKTAKTLKSSLTNQLRKFLEAQGLDADPSFMVKMMNDAVAETFSAANVKKVKDELQKNKAA